MADFRRRLGAVILWGLTVFSAAAQGDEFFVRPIGEVLLPPNTYNDPLTGQSLPLYSPVGFGAGSIVDFQMLPWLVPFVRAEYGFIPYQGGSALQFADGSLGVGLRQSFTDRLSVRWDNLVGLSELFLPKLTGTAYSAGTRLGLDYRIAPAFTLSAGAGYSTYFGSKSNILSAVTGGVSFTYNLSALGGERARLTVEDMKLEAVFPSLYAYYDDNPFGTVKVVNHEDAAITDIRVSFNAGHYMDQPKVCGEYDSLKAGGSLTVPVKALFTDSVLNITQGLEAKGEIIVSYSYLGSQRVVREPVDFRMHHRNAITWSDDRRAAAFVSPTNPAALWFAKFATGIVNDRLRADLNKPLQYAMGLFEAERIYGLNYVLVPANDYSVKHEIKDYIDSVQFPHQTLINRGGDCSDLAILFGSLMESVGVEAAFITVPGHIYAAFDTGLSEEEARRQFSDPGLLIFRDHKVWIPVEITMVKDGFLKAWRVGAKEWVDNTLTGTASFYRLRDCWQKYPSTAFPDVNPRFVLPENTAVVQAIDATVDRYVLREIIPQVQSLEARVAGADPGFRANELGVLYASYGLLPQSWASMAEAAKRGFTGAWTNLGNITFLQKNYQLALMYFQYALRLDPSDDTALLGMARCQYELETFDASDQTYASLKQRNPELAAKFGYLGSIFGGEGRAWSLSERFATTTWVKKPGTIASANLAPAPPVSSRLPTESDKTPVLPVRMAVSPPTLASRPDFLAGVPVPTAEIAPQGTVAKAPLPIYQDQLVFPSSNNPPMAAVAPNHPPSSPVPESVPAGTTPSSDTPVSASDVWTVTQKGFPHPIQGLGKWQFAENLIRQQDPDQFFAKVLTSAAQTSSQTRYSFSARAVGRGWVGVGLHLLVDGKGLHNGFGEGESWLIWLTRDPVHFKKDLTRLQIYHSTSDVAMTLVAEAPVDVSMKDWNQFAIVKDTAANTLTVQLNDHVLTYTSPDLLGKGDFVALRSLDKAEFQDFIVEAKP